MAGQPWMKWFPGDWLKAPDVRSLSPAARGLWFDMLCLMHSSGRRGYLLVGDSAPSLEQLARMTGCSTDVLTPLLTELRSSGVFDCTEHGVMYCRRMVRESEKAAKCSEAGKKGGGNPALKTETFKGHPKGVPKGLSKGSSDSDSDSSCSLENKSGAYDSIFSHYQKYHPRARSNDKDKAKVMDRLREGHSAEEIIQAIDGCHKSPYHCGENPSGTLYQSLELIVRDSKHVQQFIEIDAAGTQPVLSEKNRRNLRSAAQFVAERGGDPNAL